tara:strand:+ start:454 stop:645 length:192 start_codon:yes stop_codon:yes gene_type:complete
MLKKLIDNIEKIEKTVSLYSSNKIKYVTAHSALVSFGYSHKEASSILSREGEPDGSDTRHRNG